MRFLIKTAVAILIFLAVGFAAVAYLVPTQAVRDRVIAMVEQETGRQLTVAGDTSFTVFPSVGVKLSEVTLSSPPNMRAGPMLHMAALNLDLKLLPLLSRSVQVERFILVRPVFDLRVDRSGRANWTFEKLAHRDRSPPVKAAGLTYSLAQAGGGASMLRDLSLGEVRIENGALQFSDERSGAQHRLDAINVALSMPRVSDPLEGKGELTWRGEKVVFATRVATPIALMGKDVSPLSLNLESRHIRGAFEGTLAAGASMVVEGDLSAQSSNVRALAHWAGTTLAVQKGLGAGAFAGRVKASGDAINFSKARLKLDGMTGQGDATLTLGGARPFLRASLSLDRLDLNAYLGPGGQPPPASVQGPGSRDSSTVTGTIPGGTEIQKQPPAGKPQPDRSLADFIEELEKSDKGNMNLQPSTPRRQVRGWSDRAFDLSGLQAIDAEVRLVSGALLYQDLKLGRSALAANLRDAVLTAELSEFQLYGGVGSGRLTLNGARQLPALAIRLDLDSVNALPLLKDAAKFDWISGRAKMAINLSGAGRSESELMRAMQGNGSIAFTDGAIEGINVPQLVRGLRQGRFDGWKRAEREKTDFSRLSGTFTIKDGVAQNSDLEMIGPLVRVTGQGSVDLPREWISYAFLPKLVATLEGQGADQTGITIPVRLEGPLSDPKLRPDLERLMQDPNLAKDAINQIGEVLKKPDAGKKVEQFLNNFLGGKKQQQ